MATKTKTISWPLAPAPESTDHVKINSQYELFINGKWQKPKSGTRSTGSIPLTDLVGKLNFKSMLNTRAFIRLCAHCLLITWMLTTTNGQAQTVACGGYHSLVLCTDGTVMSWGENSHGCIGDGTLASPVLEPVVAQTAAVGSITSLAAGTSTSYAINALGEVWSWGLNNYGQLGNAGTTQQPLPVQVASTLTGSVVAIAAGDFHAVALKDDGTLWAWGYNQWGMVGDNTLVQRTSPVPVSSTYGGGITSLACGSTHTLALKNDGSVWAWGQNQYGQVGIGGWTTLDEPVQCNSMTDSVVAIAAGSVHSLALKSDGTVWAWGRNSTGQLGNGMTSNTPVTDPVQVTGLTDVVRITAFVNTSYAIRSDGTVWAWGSNISGEMTNAFDITGSATPGPVSALGTEPYIYHSAGAHALAIGSDGTLFSWGSRDFGVIGDGGATTGSQAEPVVLINVCSVSTTIEQNEAGSEIAERGLSIQPNPAHDRARLIGPNGKIERVDLYDATGRMVKSWMNTTVLESLVDLRPGLHTVVAHCEGGVLGARIVLE